MKVLESFGELEWRSASIIDMDDPVLLATNKRLTGKDNFRTRPPFTAWRWKNPNSKIEQLVVESVNSFSGNVEWTIHVKETGNRNWLIETKRCREIKDSIQWDLRKFPTVGQYLEAIDPQFGKDAAEDVPRLAEHIKNYVQKHLNP